MSKKRIKNEKQLRSAVRLSTIRSAVNVFGRGSSPASDLQKENAIVGEVRVKVKLTNAGDEVLVRRGLLPPERIRSYEADALVDTGAVRSVLPIHVVQELGLATVRTARATYANDLNEDVDVTEMVGIHLMSRRTTEETLVRGSEVIIGQTVLESLDLFVDFLSRRVIPNPAHPDQPVVKIKGSRVFPMHACCAADN